MSKKLEWFVFHTNNYDVVQDYFELYGHTADDITADEMYNAVNEDAFECFQILVDNGCKIHNDIWRLIVKLDRRQECTYLLCHGIIPPNIPVVQEYPLIRSYNDKKKTNYTNTSK